MKLTLTLTDEQLATIKQVQGPDFDLQRLAQSYLTAKVETDRQLLDVLEKPFLCRTEDLKVNNELP